MVRINLLPHRQIKRAERQRQFNLMLLATFVAGVVIVFMGQTYITARIDTQQSRNKRLEQAIAKLDKEIAEIKTLKELISSTLERKQVVEDLQSNRGRTVRLLDEVARVLPEGISLKTLNRKSGVVTLEGVADTNARIAALVRNIAASQWLESPVLVEIKAVTGAGKIKQNAFTLTFKQKSPKPAEPEKPKATGKDKKA